MFESALEKFPHKNNVTVQYKSYELDPYAEVTPTKNYYELLSNKIGISLEEAKQNAAHIREQATTVGLTYHFDTIQPTNTRSEEHTSELQSRGHLVCRLLLEKKKKKITEHHLHRTK